MVNWFIKRFRFNSLLTKTQSTIMSAAAVVGFMQVLASMLGFLFRGLNLSYFNGDSVELNIFTTADLIPSLVFVLLSAGTISAVFIPTFTELINKDRKQAWKTASTVITVSLFGYAVVAVLVLLFSEQFFNFISRGAFMNAGMLTDYNLTGPQLGGKLISIMLLGQALLLVSTFITSIAQSFKYFFLSALAPVVYYFGMLFGTIFLSQHFGIFGPAYGVIIGAFLHLLVQIPLLSKIKPDLGFSLNFKDQFARKIFKLMPARIFGAGIIQASAIVNNSFALAVSNTSAVPFSYGYALQALPVRIIGMSIAVAAFPTLAAVSAEKSLKKFKKVFLTTFHQGMFLIIPVSVILLVMRVQVVRIIFGIIGGDGISWPTTVRIAYVVAFFSLSIFAQGAFFLISRAFYSLKDTATPVAVNTATILLSFALTYFFVDVLGLGIWSIAASYSIALILDAIILFYLLHQKVGGFNLNDVFGPFIKISYSAALMGICLYLPMKSLDSFFLDTTRTLQLIILTAIACFAGMVAYLFFTYIFKVQEIDLLYKLLQRFNIKHLGSLSTATKQATDYVLEDQGLD